MDYRNLRFDMHCHVVGKGNDLNTIYFNPDNPKLLFIRGLYFIIEKEYVLKGADKNHDGLIEADEYFDLIYNDFKNSKELDALVLLAMDAIYKDGKPDMDKTDMVVSNGYLSQVIDWLNNRLANDGLGDKKRFFMGASVNPNREDWETEMERIIFDKNVVLMKLIPSAQLIDLSVVNPRYYKKLADAGIPLVCHTGPEYSYDEGIYYHALDSYTYLKHPLSNGVTVVAAHCATPVFPIVDKNDTYDFLCCLIKHNLLNDNKLYGDISAFSLASRNPIIPRVVENFPAEWLVNGSDIPIPIGGVLEFPYLNKNINFLEYLKIVNTKNPFDRDVRIKRAFGFKESIFKNAGKILRFVN